MQFSFHRLSFPKLRAAFTYSLFLSCALFPVCHALALQADLVPAPAASTAVTAAEPQSTTPQTPAPESRPPEPGQLATPANSAPSGAEKAAQAVTNLPNTMSAPPFTVWDKFDYRVIQAFGLRGFLGAFVGASIGQANGSPSEWGGGVEGYAKRYASGFGGNISRQSFAFILESTFHEDPRYFPSEDKGFRSRSLNALKQVVACKTDAGESTFAYARVFSTFGAAQLVNVWQPNSTGSVGDGFKRGVYGLGADFAYNLMQEFFPFTRPSSLRHRHRTDNP